MQRSPILPGRPARAVARPLHPPPWQLWRERFLVITIALLIIAFAANNVRGAAITDNLLAWWGFESGLADQSGNGRNLTLVNSGGGLPTITNGGVGGSNALRSSPILLDYSDGPHNPPGQLAGGFARYGTGVVDPLDFATASAGFAVQAWVNLEQLLLAQSILFNRDVQTGNSQPVRNGWELHLGHRLNDPSGPNDGKNELKFITKTDFGAAVVIGGLTTLTTNNWHHILFTSYGTGGTLYLNGVALGSDSHGILHPSAHDLFLGVVDANSSGVPKVIEPLRGLMDDVALWDRYITPDEVTLLYGNGRGLNAQSVPDGGVPFAFAATLAVCLAGHRRLRSRRNQSA